jgi:hypothetical protein
MGCGVCASASPQPSRVSSHEPDVV